MNISSMLFCIRKTFPFPSSCNRTPKVENVFIVVNNTVVGDVTNAPVPVHTVGGEAHAIPPAL